MLVGGHLIHVEVYVFLEGLPETRNQAEDADRTGQRALVGKDLVGAAADPVAARCGIAAVAGHDRLALLEQGDLPLDGSRSLDAAARAVDAEDHGLDGRVAARLGDFAGEIVADIAVALVVHYDLAVGINHGDLLLGPDVGFDLGGRIVFQGHVFQVLGLLDAAQRAEIVAHLVVIPEFVHQPVGQGVFARVDFQIVDPGIVLLRRKVAGAGHGVGHHAPDGAEHLLVLLLVLRTHLALDVGLAGRFVLAVPDQLDVDAEVVDQILVVHQVGAHTGDHHVAVGVEDDLVGHGGQVVVTGRKTLAIGDHGFPAFPEPGERGAELLGLGDVHAESFPLEVDELDLRIGRSRLQGPDRIEQRDALAHIGAHRDRIEGERLLALLPDGLRNVDFQDRALGNGGLRFLADRRGQRADEPEKDEIEQHKGDQRTEATAENNFPKRFHILINDDSERCSLQI